MQKSPRKQQTLAIKQVFTNIVDSAIIPKQPNHTPNDQDIFWSCSTLPGEDGNGYLQTFNLKTGQNDYNALEKAYHNCIPVALKFAYS